MRALVKREAKPGLWLEEVPIPTCGPRDVLIKIKKTAICGTDLHIYKWDKWSQDNVPVPMHVGHEFAGEIIETGTDVSNFKIGDRVSGEGHIVCGTCRNCRAGIRHLCRNTYGVGVNRPGAFADYLCLPAENAFKLPPEISDDIGAILDPLGNAVHTALSFDLVGEDVLITGAGPIGIMAACIARHVGARHVVITDINNYRLDLVNKLGIARGVNVLDEPLADVMSSLGMTEGFDVGLEMSGQPQALRQMVAQIMHGGKIALLGVYSQDVTLDWNQLVFKGVQLKGIYGREMYETWYKMISMLQSGLDIQPMITHHLPVSDFEIGFETMLSGQTGKVILEWSE